MPGPNVVRYVVNSYPQTLPNLLHDGTNPVFLGRPVLADPDNRTPPHGYSGAQVTRSEHRLAVAMHTRGVLGVGCQYTIPGRVQYFADTVVFMGQHPTKGTPLGRQCTNCHYSCSGARKNCAAVPVAGNAPGPVLVLGPAVVAAQQAAQAPNPAPAPAPAVQAPNPIPVPAPVVHAPNPAPASAIAARALSLLATPPAPRAYSGWNPINRETLSSESLSADNASNASTEVPTNMMDVDMADVATNEAPSEFEREQSVASFATALSHAPSGPPNGPLFDTRNQGIGPLYDASGRRLQSAAMPRGIRLSWAAASVDPGATIAPAFPTPLQQIRDATNSNSAESFEVPSSALYTNPEAEGTTNSHNEAFRAGLRDMNSRNQALLMAKAVGVDQALQQLQDEKAEYIAAWEKLGISYSSEGSNSPKVLSEDEDALKSLSDDAPRASRRDKGKGKAAPRRRGRSASPRRSDDEDSEGNDDDKYGYVRSFNRGGESSALGEQGIHH